MIHVGALTLALLLPATLLETGELKPPVDVSSVADRVLAARPGDSLLLVIGDRIITARVDRTGMSTRGVHLRVSGDRLRGQVGGQRVDLEMRSERISGHIGNLEVALEVGRSEGSLKIVGRFGARAVDEDLAPGAVTADIGPCRYTLKFQHGEYAGQVGCGAQHGAGPPSAFPRPWSREATSSSLRCSRRSSPASSRLPDHQDGRSSDWAATSSAGTNDQKRTRNEASFSYPVPAVRTI